MLLTALALGLGIFELASGIAVSFIPQLHASIEIGLLFHILIGFIILWPLGVYLLEHRRLNENSQDTTSIGLGKATFLFAAISLITGFGATAEAAFSNHVSPLIRFGHK